MDILIDTQVLLWAQAGEKGSLIPPNAQRYLLDDRYVKWVSEISLLEIAIKAKIGKLREFKTTLPRYIEQIRQDGFRLIAVQRAHIIAYDRIMFFDEHRNPFDRLILSTALHEGWSVMSADHKFSLYKDQIDVIW